MIDFHCHLDLYSNALALLPKVDRLNDFTLAVTTSPRAWQATSRVFAGYGSIRVALGMHPEIVANKKNERDLLISLIEEAEFIGEVGIDGSSQNVPTIDRQKIIFREVLLECERVGGKIMSIHSRNAADLALDLIKQHCRKSIPVLHWFSGSNGELRRAIDLDCWFSIGPPMLASKKGRSLVAEIPRDRILPESDGPFARLKSLVVMPWQAIDIAHSLALLWNVKHAEVIQQMLINLNALLMKANLKSL